MLRLKDLYPRWATSEQAARNGWLRKFACGIWRSCDECPRYELDIQSPEPECGVSGKAADLRKGIGRYGELLLTILLVF